MPSTSLLLSALFAGVVAVLVTLAIERWGGIHGGVLGTVPSTLVPAGLGIWVATAGDAEQFQRAMGIVPVGLLLNAGFLWLWRIVPDMLPDWGLGIRLSAITLVTLAAWLACAAAAMVGVDFLLAQGTSSLLIGWLALVLGIIIGVATCWKHVPAPPGANPVGPSTLVARGLAASLAIGIAVHLAGSGDSLASGLMSIFPAIFTTSMVALWISQGEAVPTGAIGPMMLGAMSVSLYALLIAVFYPMSSSTLTLAGACVAGWLLAVAGVNLPTWLWLRRRAGIATD